MMNTTTTRGTMTKDEFAAALAWNVKNIGGRLGALDLLKTCGRCAGSGRYSWNAFDGDKCFGCMGSGKALPKLNTALVEVVKARVEAGDLAPYLARSAAIVAAKLAIKPLATKARELYEPIGALYTERSRAKVDSAVFVESPIFFAQGVNNAIYWGGSTHGLTASGPACMGVTEIVSAVKYGKVNAVDAVALIEERIAMLEALNAAFFA